MKKILSVLTVILSVISLLLSVVSIKKKLDYPKEQQEEPDDNEGINDVDVSKNLETIENWTSARETVKQMLPKDYTNKTFLSLIETVDDIIEELYENVSNDKGIDFDDVDLNISEVMNKISASIESTDTVGLAAFNLLKSSVVSTIDSFK